MFERALVNIWLFILTFSLYRENRLTNTQVNKLDWNPMLICICCGLWKFSLKVERNINFVTISWKWGVFLYFFFRAFLLAQMLGHRRKFFQWEWKAKWTFAQHTKKRIDYPNWSLVVFMILFVCFCMYVVVVVVGKSFVMAFILLILPKRQIYSRVVDSHVCIYFAHSNDTQPFG